MTSRSLPSRIGRYEITDRLGAGGMGVLYLARDPLLRRTVAIKMLAVDDDDLRERFAREARSAAALSHVHIVTIFDVGEDQGHPFMAMEYLDGETMGEMIRRKAPVPLQRRLQLLLELCSGLGYAHRLGIIHRDIKPANLMITGSGTLKILDFGLARLTHDASGGLTHSGALLGTPHYMSPEQIEGGLVDHRSDIFSVGLVLYELLTYRKAYAGEAMHVVLHKITHESPPPMREIDPTIDPALEAIVRKATERLPEQRYQSLELLSADAMAFIKELARRPDADATVIIPRLGDRPDVAARKPDPGSGGSGGRTPSPTPRVPNFEGIARRREAQIQLHLDEAMKHLTERRYDEAVEQCELAAVLNPEEPRVLDLLSRAHTAREEQQVAAWLADAEAEIAAGALTSAEQLIRQSLERRPASAGAQALQRRIQEIRREQEQVRERARAAAHAVDRARANLADGALESAARSAAEALAHQPDHAEAQAIRRQALEAIEVRRRAMEHEQRASDAVAEARKVASRGDLDAAAAGLDRFAPSHPLVETARAAILQQIEAREQRRREAEDAARARAIEEEQRRQQAEQQRQEAEQQRRQAEQRQRDLEERQHEAEQRRLDIEQREREAEAARAERQRREDEAQRARTERDRLAAEQRAREEQERRAAEQRAQEERAAAEQKAREEKQRLAAEQRAREERAAAEQKAREEKQRLAAEQRAREERAAAEQKAQADQERRAAEQRAQEERAAAEQRARDDAAAHATIEVAPVEQTGGSEEQARAEREERERAEREQSRAARRTEAEALETARREAVERANADASVRAQVARRNAPQSETIVIDPELQKRLSATPPPDITRAPVAKKWVAIAIVAALLGAAGAYALYHRAAASKSAAGTETTPAARRSTADILANARQLLAGRHPDQALQLAIDAYRETHDAALADFIGGIRVAAAKNAAGAAAEAQGTDAAGRPEFAAAHAQIEQAKALTAIEDTPRAVALYAEAERGYRAAVTASTSDPAAFVRRAEESYKNGATERAVDYALTARRLDPTHQAGVAVLTDIRKAAARETARARTAAVAAGAASTEEFAKAERRSRDAARATTPEDTLAQVSASKEAEQLYRSSMATAEHARADRHATAERHASQARTLLSQKRLDEADAELAQAKAAEPQNAAVQGLTRDLAEARRTATRDALNQRVGALLEQARGLDPRQAVPLLQQASGLDPSRDDVKRELQRRLDELNAHTPPAGSSAAPGAGARDSASAAKTARDADASAIVQVLNRYRLGWEGLDVNAIQAVYPGVNAKTLRDEFKNVKSQPMTLSLQPPDFDATGNAATIRCHVVSRIDVKAGAGLKLDRDAVFHLAKAGGAWRITSLDYR